MTLRECLYQTIHRNNKPLKLIAEEIGMSENYLTRSALPDPEESDTGTGCRFPLKKLIPLICSTGIFVRFLGQSVRKHEPIQEILAKGIPTMFLKFGGEPMKKLLNEKGAEILQQKIADQVVKHKYKWRLKTETVNEAF